jgi:hypothetical protein
MNLRFTLELPDRLVVHLMEGTDATSVAVPQARHGVQSLVRALDAAAADGYGECFWPAVEGGHYWWMFRREAEALEVVTMWNRGGASGWEHVFRAVDAAEWFHSRVSAEAARLGLDALS